MYVSQYEKTQEWSRELALFSRQLMIMFLLTSLACFVVSIVPAYTISLEVQTTYGPVLGSRRHLVDPRTGETISWSQFSGISYAAPPVGDLRFRPPQPLQPWSEPRFVEDDDLTTCPQIILGALYPPSDEDCLYLNVHVPDNVTDDGGLLPVMVWIHGGGFLSGDGRPTSFGPQYFMAHEVIIITINYRLGPLGYLSLGTEI